MDRNRWYPATLFAKREEVIGELKKVEYRLGFRIYPTRISPEQFDSLKKYWPGRTLQMDSRGEQYYGDNENLDEWVFAYSKRLQLPGSHIHNETKDLAETESYFVDDLIPVLFMIKL